VPNQLILSDPAKRDILAIVRRSLTAFGSDAALRYENLIAQALYDLRADSAPPGSKERPELMVPGARTYHLYFSRDHVAGDRVKGPRHFLVYRTRQDGIVEVARILHDSCDLEQHLPAEYKSKTNSK